MHKLIKVSLYLLIAINFVVIGESNAKSLKINFNQNWQYLERNYKTLEELKGAPQQTWQNIDLPHTWNAFDTVDSTPGYRRSASWYKKQFLDKRPYPGQTLLYFEGANYETEVYLNGQKVGTHTGGYIGFSIDLTKHINQGEINTLHVRVSNRYNPHLIPSQKADFFLFGGITRDVWLQHKPQVSLSHISVKTPEVSHASATTSLDVELHSHESKRLLVSSKIVDANNKIIINHQENIEVSAGDNAVSINLAALKNPDLWSPNSPTLYTAKVSIQEGNKIWDSHNIRFGYRWFSMDPQQGFYLNGKQLLIRGTHRHEEYAGLGNALPNSLHRKDMQMIKDLGANFVRLGHYPQDPEVYAAADELGLLIWDELPWCRGGKGGQEWEQNTEYLLSAQIKQNINHPSIIFWSLGNELYWEEDFEGGGRTEILNPYIKKLNSLAKNLDPSRLTTVRKYYPGSDLVDAFSPSIWAGWYGGSYNQYEDALNKAHKEYDAFLHMEYGGSSHVGRHTETPISASGFVDEKVSVEDAMNQKSVKSVAKDSDWNENYIVDLFDWHLNVSENFEDFAGNAQWAFKDFGTPLRPENPLPYVNQKGLVDRNGKPKDAYYVFASYWSPSPMCWIESHTWTHRNGPKEGRDVTVYCNTQQAELFLNGQSLGKKDKQKNKVPAGGLVWKVPFQNGVNKLSVTGFDNNKQVADDSLDITYLVGKHGKFNKIKLDAKRIEGNRFLITAEAVDENGNRVLDFSERAHFFNIGDHGHLLENFGSPTRSSIIEMASGYAAIEFEASNTASMIEFRSQNIKGVYVNIDPKQP